MKPNHGFAPKNYKDLFEKKQQRRAPGLHVVLSSRRATESVLKRYPAVNAQIDGS